MKGLMSSLLKMFEEISTLHRSLLSSEFLKHECNLYIKLEQFLMMFDKIYHFYMMNDDFFLLDY